MARRILPALASFVLVAGLSACGDSGDGAATAPPPDLANEGVSDGGSPSDGGGAGAENPDEEGDDSVAAPDIPAPDPAEYQGMEEQTPEGAEQAFKYYWDTTFWGFQTGDPRRLSSLHADECSVCVSSVQTIEELRDANEYWSETNLEEQVLEGEPGESEGFVVTYIFIVSAHSEPSGDGGAVEIGTKVYSIVGGIAWRDSRWVMEGADVFSESY